MSVVSLEEFVSLEDSSQDFTVSPKDKLLYGEIYTPFSLIKRMLDLFDPAVFSDMNAKWLDTGAGTGFFSMVLYDRLNKGLKYIIIDDKERSSHIIEKMMFLIEIKPENIVTLRKRLGPKANIIHADFLSYGVEYSYEKFDYIIGNPPYNANGKKKVPTNTASKKKNDGQTIWVDFIKTSLKLLKEPKGQLCYIVPSIWMKPDKAGLYNILTSYKIEKLYCFTNTETNSLFRGEAQTPTCYFLLSKGLTTLNTSATKQINLYDRNNKKYIDYTFQLGQPIPLFGQTIIQKLHPFIVKAGSSLKVVKTNMPSKVTSFSDTFHEINYPFINIKTCHLNDQQPVLVTNYSSHQQAHSTEVKLVLAHKMYGFPFLDAEGIYGISNRDNYVIIGKTIDELKHLKEFLSTKLALYIFDSTRYRMKYLEKYAFEFIPDINKLPDFPKTINDDTVADYFGLSNDDRQHISREKTYGRIL